MGQLNALTQVVNLLVKNFSGTKTQFTFQASDDLTCGPLFDEIVKGEDETLKLEPTPSADNNESVSYTHLTLPTIYSV